MKSIDYLSIFLLLGSAPGWQPFIDDLAPGLGLSLVVLLVMASVNLVRGECRQQPRKNAPLNAALPMQAPPRCRNCANPCFEFSTGK